MYVIDAFDKMNWSSKTRGFQVYIKGKNCIVTDYLLKKKTFISIDQRKFITLDGRVFNNENKIIRFLEKLCQV